MPSALRVAAAAEPGRADPHRDEERAVADRQARLARLADTISARVSTSGSTRTRTRARWCSHRRHADRPGRAAVPDDLVLKLRTMAREMERRQAEADASRGTDEQSAHNPGRAPGLNTAPVTLS